MNRKDIANKVLGIKPLAPVAPEVTIEDYIANVGAKVDTLIEVAKTRDERIDELKNLVKEVTASIENIDTEIDLSGIEKLLEKIASKEQKEIDLSVLGDVLLAVKALVDKPDKETESIAPELLAVQTTLRAINEAINGIELPSFDYKKLAEVIKENLTINMQGGGGFSSVFITGVNGVKRNPATEEKQDAGNALLTSILAASGGSTYNYIKKDDAGTYVYYGYAATGPLWKFKRKTASTGIWEVASGSGDFDTNWTNRVSKTYTYF